MKFARGVTVVAGVVGIFLAGMIAENLRTANRSGNLTRVETRWVTLQYEIRSGDPAAQGGAELTTKGYASVLSGLVGDPDEGRRHDRLTRLVILLQSFAEAVRDEDLESPPGPPNQTF